jgi:predicted O-methyltransferase YrrM
MSVTETTFEVRAFHNAFARTDLHASDPATIDLACMLANFVGARNIIEAGTYRGHMASALAFLLKITGKTGGKVYTADTVDVFSSTLADASMDPVRDYIHYHVGDFGDMLKSVPVLADFAYIDASSETNPHLRMEHLALAMQRMNTGGILMVDDTQGDWADAPLFRRMRGLQLPQHRGLTILMKD